jgi:predicted nucleotidyltransferase
MRLTPAQIQTVLRTVAEHAGDSAATYLFGSRLNDQARGGDLDLLVETARPMPLLERARLQLDLETRLGLPVDVIVHGPGTPVSTFQQLVRARAQPLRLPT